MVLPTCPMAEFALPRHSAVMERLRRRIELCRRHHSTCEARYEAVSPERLELERQHTFALHQRCIQAKAKRAGKHRQPPAAASAPRLDAADGPEHGRPATVSRQPLLPGAVSPPGSASERLSPSEVALWCCVGKPARRGLRVRPGRGGLEDAAERVFFQTWCRKREFYCGVACDVEASCTVALAFLFCRCWLGLWSSLGSVLKAGSGL